MLWYHTMELAPGVVTSGWFDLRDVPGRIPMPASLAGKRVLDIGTFDGFWAFEMEERGASEVMAIDLLDAEEWDWPAGSTDDIVRVIGQRKGVGEGFEIAAESRGSSVRREVMSIYDLSSKAVGSFDFIFLGSLLMHLRDPVAGLASVRAVCGGQLLVLDAVEPFLSLLHPRRPVADLDGRGRPWWWRANRAGLIRMLEAAGFEIVGAPRWVLMPAGKGNPRVRIGPRILMSHSGRELVRDTWIGDPHLAVLARPAEGTEFQRKQPRHVAR
jgi:tRNA (mo5U34)-methyltransferase